MKEEEKFLAGMLARTSKIEKLIFLHDIMIMLCGKLFKYINLTNSV